jgi:hypothetical protein
MLPFELVEKISITMSTPDLVKFGQANKHYNSIVNDLIKKRHDIKVYIAQYIDDVDGFIELCHKHKIYIAGHPIFQVICGQQINIENTMKLCTFGLNYSIEDKIVKFLMNEFYLKNCINLFRRKDGRQIKLDSIGIEYTISEYVIRSNYDPDISYNLCYWNPIDGHCYSTHPKIALHKKVIINCNRLYACNQVIDLKFIMTSIDPLKNISDKYKIILSRLIIYIKYGFDIIFEGKDPFDSYRFQQINWIKPTPSPIQSTHPPAHPLSTHKILKK